MTTQLEYDVLRLRFERLITRCEQLLDALEPWIPLFEELYARIEAVEEKSAAADRAAGITRPPRRKLPRVDIVGVLDGSRRTLSGMRELGRG